MSAVRLPSADASINSHCRARALAHGRKEPEPTAELETALMPTTDPEPMPMPTMEPEC